MDVLALVLVLVYLALDLRRPVASRLAITLVSRSGARSTVKGSERPVPRRS